MDRAQNPEFLTEFNTVALQQGEGCYPWPTTPLEYVRFAEQDIADGGRRGLVNAISNAKRAIHAHVDFLLHNCGRCLKRSNFPEKLSLLNRLGIIAPSLLEKYNQLRNVIEHEYAQPSREEAQEVIDIACLFLEATRSYTRPLPSLLHLSGHAEEISHCVIQCEWDDQAIIVSLFTDESSDESGQTFQISAAENDALWQQWVATILKITRDAEGPYIRCVEPIEIV